MKIKQTFFWHLFTETAISCGWDYEESLESFVSKQNKTTMDAIAFTAYGNALTEMDIYKASKGEATEAFTAFYKSVYEKQKGKSTAETCVQQSMHSGSSDYLYFKDLEAMFKHES